ncbi:MAG: beta-galactosidase [Treponema sp.]|jgi:beta-galactosidase|nr:beta-galactosidase [Treponema sp.]
MTKAVRYPPVTKCPHILHGGDYNPEQWLKWKDTVWREDMRMAKLAGINTLTVGIFSWAALEPNEGEYRFEWIDEVMDMLAENGITAVLATPSGARPAWMSQKYPEILRMNRNRTKNLHGERHNHCLSSPVYREKVIRINTLLAERYKDHPALALWHISNEYGGECHCPLCQARFREWLQDRYKTLDALNEAWWTSFWSHTYTDWEQIESPSELGDTNLHGLNLSWRRFTSDQFIDFYRCETAPLKKSTPHVPCTTNLMGPYLGFDAFKMAKVLDVVSWDNYPHWRGTDEDAAWEGMHISFNHDLNRGLKDKPFLLMESSPSATNWQGVAKLRRPGVHMLQSMQAVAHGSDSVLYFQFRKGRGASEKFHGAVVDHEGTENTRVFRDVSEVGARLKTMDPIVGCSTPSRVALIFDWENAWALGDAKGFLQQNTAYDRTVIEHYSAFWKQAVPVDIIESTRSFDGYDIVVAPMLYMLRKDDAGVSVAEKIAAFVKNGGTFVATYITGYVDENDLVFTGGFPGPLKDVLGIWCEEIDSLYPEDRNSFVWNGKSYAVHEFCELVHQRGAEALAKYDSDFYAGKGALTVNRYGKGEAYFLAARTHTDFLDDFYHDLVDQCGVRRVIASPLPPGVTAQVRSDGKTDYVFLLNFSPVSAKVDTGFAGIKELAPWDALVLEHR